MGSSWKNRVPEADLIDGPPCPVCKGAGAIEEAAPSGRIIGEDWCGHCDGSGEDPNAPIARAHGARAGGSADA